MAWDPEDIFYDPDDPDMKGTVADIREKRGRFKPEISSTPIRPQRPEARHAPTVRKLNYFISIGSSQLQKAYKIAEIKGCTLCSWFYERICSSYMFCNSYVMMITVIQTMCLICT